MAKVLPEPGSLRTAMAPPLCLNRGIMTHPLAGKGARESGRAPGARQAAKARAGGASETGRAPAATARM